MEKSEDLRKFIRTTLQECLNEQIIPLRLVQGGALTNPPKKLYHGTAYKISYDELNMHEHRSKDGKGFNHTAKGSGYIGVYFYEEKYIGFNVKEKIGDIHLVTYKSNTSLDYADRAAHKLKSNFAYVYEAEISNDAAILSFDKLPSNAGGVKEKDLDQYIYNTKIKASEYDGAGPGEFVIWNKDVIKSWNIKLIAVKNPYYGNAYEKWRDIELKERWIDTLGTVGAHYLSITEYIWFTDVSKLNYFLENYNKNSGDKYNWLLTYKESNKPKEASDHQSGKTGSGLASLQQNEDVLNEKCWKGYKKKGMKTMFGKKYPNCVKK